MQNFLSDDHTTIIIRRLTTMWAVSEAMLGGVLHAMRLPMTGLFMATAAAMIIILIASVQKRNKIIIQVTMVVMLIKAIIAPHTPITAYFAVAFQGFLGTLLLYQGSLFRLRAVLFGALVLGQSGIQKILILTLIFGHSLWESIDIFIAFVLNQVSVATETVPFHFSTFIVVLYVGLHIIVGILAVLWVLHLQQRHRHFANGERISNSQRVKLPDKKPQKKKKGWWRKPGYLAIVLMSVFLYLVSFFQPETVAIWHWTPLLIIVRSAAILMLWFYWLSPIVSRWLRTRLKRHQSSYSAEIEQTMAMFPEVKLQVFYCWRTAAKEHWSKRISAFSFCLFSLIFAVDESGNHTHQ
jgi:hypothetical protein